MITTCAKCGDMCTPKPGEPKLCANCAPPPEPPKVEPTEEQP